MSRYEDLEKMLAVVADALGEQLLKQVAFVGGCTTGLLVTDTVTQESIRYTEDVDLITHVIGFSEWAAFQSKLKKRGFNLDVKEFEEIILKDHKHLNNASIPGALLFFLSNHP